MSCVVASRCVRGGTLNRVSISFRIDVQSVTRCETYCGFTHGDTTIISTRNPVTLNNPGV